MQHRTLGRTGYETSTIGFGAWGIGGTMWIGARDDDSCAALRRAIDLECTFLDTAAVYGNGRSEELVGRVWRERRGVTPSGRRVIIATKIPPLNRQWPAARGTSWQQTFPPEHIIASTEASLRRLGVERLDLQQLHVWRDEWLDARDAWYGAIEQLKRQGKVAHVGISINDHDPGSALRAVSSGLFDTVQVIYNIFDQSPEDELFAATARHHIGVIARVPLDEGGLTGAITAATTFADGDFRQHYFGGTRREDLARHLETLQPLVRAADAPDLAALALRFCLSHKAVATVIPGMRSATHVETNARTSMAGPLPTAVRSALRHHRWERNWYAPATAETKIED